MIHTEVEGEGQTVLFVHADFVDGRMWDGVRRALAHRYRVASFDKTGYGRSDAATGPVCRRRELEAVWESLGGGKMHLVGCSNGGQQALDFALEHPERVLSLTLVNSSPSGFVPQGAPPAELLAMMDATQKGDLATASELQLVIWFDGPHRSKAVLDTHRREARALAATMNRLFVERGTFFVADAVPLDPLDPPALARLNEVACPTLVVSGALDYSENQRASRLLADGIPGAKWAQLPDCAHAPPLEDSAGFARLLGDFLESYPVTRFK